MRRMRPPSGSVQITLSSSTSSVPGLPICAATATTSGMPPTSGADRNAVRVDPKHGLAERQQAARWRFARFVRARAAATQRDAPHARHVEPEEVMRGEREHLRFGLAARHRNGGAAASPRRPANHTPLRARTNTRCRHSLRQPADGRCWNTVRRPNRRLPRPTSRRRVRRDWPSKACRQRA